MFFLNTVFLVPANDNKWAASSNPTTCWVSFLKPSHQQIPGAPEAGGKGSKGSVKPEPRELCTSSDQSPTMQARSDLKMQLRWAFRSRAGTWDSTQLFGGSFSFQTSAFPCRKAENPLHQSISDHQATGAGFTCYPGIMVSVLREENAHLEYLGVKRRNCYYLEPATAIWFIFKWRVHFIHRNFCSLLF